jgi:hypothetical protein
MTSVAYFFGWIHLSMTCSSYGLIGEAEWVAFSKTDEIPINPY